MIFFMIKVITFWGLKILHLQIYRFLGICQKKSKIMRRNKKKGVYPVLVHPSNILNKVSRKLILQIYLVDLYVLDEDDAHHDYYHDCPDAHHVADLTLDVDGAHEVDALHNPQASPSKPYG